ncbi:UvrD-helicase domain-containing protein, partial [Stomatohabitans albus]|uniref:UvrD-helicase domain-containing protein n=1 Tax=Stomatohabitans albus TaxID=3110766 RepID=UPI00300C4505
MPMIILDKLASKLDGSVRGKFMSFLQKLSQDDTTSGLHIEPMKNAVDPRVRTGRVDDFWRAVLFKITGDGEPHYLVHGVWPHDEAIAKAMKVTLTVNPTNGQAMVREAAQQIPIAKDTWGNAGQARADMSTDEGAGVASAPVVPELPSWLETRGYHTEGLMKVLGLPEDVATRAMAMTSDDALLNLAEQEQGWLAAALMELAVGTSLQVIVEKLDLDAAKPAANLSEDEQLIEALQTTAAKEKFTFIKNQAALKQVIEDGDFGQWRVFLHPEQRRYATQSYNGPFRLTGAAGTGKTVVLLHRTRMLSEGNAEARVVLTTFTRNLADSLAENLASLDPGITQCELGESGVVVAGVDALVARVLREAGTRMSSAVEEVLGHARTEVNTRTNKKVWSDAIDVAMAYLPEELANLAFFESEYATVVLPKRITTLEQYLRVRRPGRGVALSREKRKAVWDVIANYRAQARVLGTIDFPEAAAIAAVWLEERANRGEG